jgi:hypothetical protein
MRLRPLRHCHRRIERIDRERRFDAGRTSLNWLQDATHWRFAADSGRLTSKPDCDLKAVGMIIWQGGNRSDRAPHRT